MNQVQIADYFGVTIQTISNWEKEGLPVKRRPGIRKPVYDVQECEKWLEQRGQNKWKVITETSQLNMQLMIF